MPELHQRFTRIWGLVSADEDALILRCRRDAEAVKAAAKYGGVTSALAIADADLLAEGPIWFSSELISSAGPEDWKKYPWFYVIPFRDGREGWPYPAQFYRPTTFGFETGESIGGEAIDEKILPTWTPDGGTPVPARRVLVRQANGAFHFWAEGRGTASIPAPHHTLGLYGEASEYRIGLERMTVEEYRELE